MSINGRDIISVNQRIGGRKVCFVINYYLAGKVANFDVKFCQIASILLAENDVVPFVESKVRIQNVREILGCGRQFGTLKAIQVLLEQLHTVIQEMNYYL